MVQGQGPTPTVAPVQIDVPQQDGQIVQVPYVVSGTAQPGLQVTVKGTNGLPTHADLDVNGDGQWTTTYGTDTPPSGEFKITATQYAGSQALGSSDPVTYTVGGTPSVSIEAPQPGQMVYKPYTIRARSPPPKATVASRSTSSRSPSMAW